MKDSIRFEDHSVLQAIHRQSDIPIEQTVSAPAVANSDVEAISHDRALARDRISEPLEASSTPGSRSATRSRKRSWTIGGMVTTGLAFFAADRAVNIVGNARVIRHCTPVRLPAPTPTYPSGMTLPNPEALIASKLGLYQAQASLVPQLNEAESYLNASPTARAAFAQIQASGAPITVNRIQINDNTAAALGKNATIQWDPTIMLQSLLPSHDVNSTACGMGSASSALLHETFHVLLARTHPVEQRLLLALTHPNLDNFEEGRVIKRANKVAQELGEDQRGTHHGATLTGRSVTDRNDGACVTQLPSEWPAIASAYQNTSDSVLGQSLNNAAARNQALQELLSDSTSLTARQASKITEMFNDHDRTSAEFTAAVTRDGVKVDVANVWDPHFQKALSTIRSLSNVQANLPIANNGNAFGA